jgi:DNA invertase Pin-like site-specific DNA recombinase
MKRVAIYLRVSTGNQTTENQRQALEGVAEKSGWKIEAVYCDNAVSGAKGRHQRPEFDRLCQDAAQRRFDLVMAWSVDRLGRSLQDLVEFLNELKALNIDLYLHQQRLDTTTPSGRALYQMLGVFAEFEREIIKDRVNAGLDRARASGKTLGRPKVDAKTIGRVKDMLGTGAGILKTAKALGVGTGTVQRIKAEMPVAANATNDQRIFEKNKILVSGKEAGC